MTLSQLILSQLADPFRIGLVIALIITMLRTRAQSGTVIPLLFGVAFIAVIIPVTTGSIPAEPLWRQVAAGIVSTAVLLGVALGLWSLWQRVRG